MSAVDQLLAFAGAHPQLTAAIVGVFILALIERELLLGWLRENRPQTDPRESDLFRLAMTAAVYLGGGIVIGWFAGGLLPI